MVWWAADNGCFIRKSPQLQPFDPGGTTCTCKLVITRNRIDENQEVRLALLRRVEAVLSRCKDEQNLTGPGTELMRTKKSGSLSGSPQKGGCCTFFEDVAKWGRVAGCASLLAFNTLQCIVAKKQNLSSLDNITFYLTRHGAQHKKGCFPGKR